MTEAPPTGTDVTLIVVNHDGESCLRECLESLLATRDTKFELLLVDNASTDGSGRILDEIEHHHPQIEVVRQSENLGYAGAVNSVLSRCRGRYIGVLNMDLRSDPNWLSPLVEFLDAHPETAAVNPLLLLRSGDAINAAGQDVHVTGLGFNRALGRAKASVGKDPFRISGLQGAAFLIRRSLLEEIQGMDTTGFLYHEDVNLSWLLGLMGHDLYCVPEAIVQHDYFLSMHAEKFYLLERNRLAMLASYLHIRTRIWLSPLLLFTEILLWSYSSLRGPSFLRAKARSYRWLHEVRGQLAARRSLCDRLRTRSDVEVLRKMKWTYSWRQFLILAREDGEPRKPLPPQSTPGR